ncbi:hypothetical protein Taro_010796 [Colocasia esculenta]|uniref:Uncharacterized protein n=1 Tax=Colocasia esculenta TaxID=4460 RepID=A0A843U4K6_COLES|nr:hypothetical protein [Colocasia esculenta]
MTFKRPVNGRDTYPRQPKLDVRTRVRDHARCGRVRKSHARALRKWSQTHEKRSKTHVGCTSNARGCACARAWHGRQPTNPREAHRAPSRKTQRKMPKKVKAPPFIGVGQRVSPGRDPRRFGPPPGRDPRRFGGPARRGPPPVRGAYQAGGLPVGGLPGGDPLRGAKLSRGDPRLRDFSSSTLARCCRVPAKLEAIWRSRILSRKSSGEVALLWEGGDLFVLRMKTPVRDSVCVKLHKGPPLRRRRFVYACEIAHMPRTRAQASVQMHKAPGDIKFVYVYIKSTHILPSARNLQEYPCF